VHQSILGHDQRFYISDRFYIKGGKTKNLILFMKPLLRSKPFMFWSIFFTIALVIFFGYMAATGVGKDIAEMFGADPNLATYKEIAQRTVVYSVVAFGIFMSMASGSITQTYELSYVLSTLIPHWVKFTKLTPFKISVLYMAREIVVGFLQIGAVLFGSLVIFSIIQIPTPIMSLQMVPLLLLGFLLGKMLFVVLRMATVAFVIRKGVLSHVSFLPMGVNFVVGFLPLAMIMGGISPALAPYVPPFVATNLMVWGLTPVGATATLPSKAVERMYLNLDTCSLTLWGLFWFAILAIFAALSIVWFMRRTTKEMPFVDAEVRRGML
jgi:hypothetical protein